MMAKAIKSLHLKLKPPGASNPMAYSAFLWKRNIASHPIAQGGSITALFIAGLEVAGYADMAVPAWGVPLATLGGI